MPYKHYTLLYRTFKIELELDEEILLKDELKFDWHHLLCTRLCITEIIYCSTILVLPLTYDVLYSCKNRMCTIVLMNMYSHTYPLFCNMYIVFIVMRCRRVKQDRKIFVLESSLCWKFIPNENV